MQIFRFTLKALVNTRTPTIKGTHIWKAPKNLKDVTLKKQCVHSVGMVELVGVHGPKSGAGRRAGGPKRVLRFLLPLLKNAEGNVELKDEM